MKGVKQWFHALFALLMALKSFVHFDMHPIEQQSGCTVQLLHQFLLNFNGLTLIATNFYSILSRDIRHVAEVKEIRQRHIGCFQLKT